jgi:ribose 5-phosphate isomerase B
MSPHQTIHFSTVYLATDHAGLVLKDAVKTWLLTQAITTIDCGATIFDGEDDFPDYIVPAAKAVAAGGPAVGAIIFGGSGQGEAMVANRLSGIRATVYYGGDERIVALGREHNDANVLSLGARFLTEAAAIAMVKVWLTTPPLLDQKYHRRNVKMDQLTRLDTSV